MTPQTNSLYTEVETLLKSIPEFLTEEKELRYNKIKEMAENGDVKLLEPLMKDERIKSAFFTPILDSFVFKTKEFKEFLDYSSSNNSYSQYQIQNIHLRIIINQNMNIFYNFLNNIQLQTMSQLQANIFLHYYNFVLLKMIYTP